MAAIVDSRIRRSWRSESGAELVELALALPLLLLVVMGIIDFGFLFQRYEVVTNAAREGARIAALPNYGGANLETNVRTRVGQYMAAAGLDDPDFDVNDDVTVSAPTPVSIGGNCMTTYTVTVTYPHAYSFVAGIMSYFGGTLSSTTLTATSTMRTEAVAGTCP
jgi:Flp pilus assembly protein TadG